jgi:hypothetical protein
VEVFWNTVAAVLTLAIFSFLYKDNPIYKFAEYLFVGVAAGWFFCLQYHNVFIPSLWNPFVDAYGSVLAGESARWQSLALAVPFALGLLMFTRFTPTAGWLSRWPMALMVGAFSGLAIIGFAQGDLVAQIEASMVDLGDGSAASTISEVILLIGLLTTLVYFFFSTEHRGAIGGISRVGIAFLMISFGASYGFTVMARVSLLIGRLQFLFYEWPSSIGRLFGP